MSADFEIWPQLAAGKTELLKWPLSLVLLMEDKNFPWIVLVPRRNGMTELHDLSKEDQAQLMMEITAASRAVQKTFSPKKVNVGMLGNMCAQLHIHVIARFEGDKGWPGPAWSAAPAVPYTPEESADLVRKLKGALEAEVSWSS